MGCDNLPDLRVCYEAASAVVNSAAIGSASGLFGISCHPCKRSRTAKRTYGYARMRTTLDMISTTGTNDSPVIMKEDNA